MRCFLFICIFHDTVKLWQAPASMLFHCRNVRRTVSLHLLHTYLPLIFVQDRLDTHDGIQNIWSRISFKRSKTVNIKNIIFGCLVGKISIFDRRKCYDLGCFFLPHPDLPSWFSVIFSYIFSLMSFISSLQTHDAAFSGLKRLSVLAVHRTKT